MTSSPDLAVDLAPRHKFGLSLKNPVMVASGTFGYGTELRRAIDINRLGALVTTGVTRTPRTGAAQPSIFETPGGLLHSTSLQNAGIHKVERSLGPVWATFDVPVILNIAARSVEEFAELAGRIEGMPGVAALELNLGSRHIEPELPFAADAGLVSRVVEAVRRQSSLPVIAKLSAGVSDVASVAVAAQDSGADAISCTNSLPGMTIDIRAHNRDGTTYFGGVSGPAIKPIALRAVWEIASQVEIPVIGIGGIMTAENAIEFFMAGATAIQVGSANFRDPFTPLKVLEGLEQFLTRENLKDLSTLIGMSWSQEGSNAEQE